MSQQLYIRDAEYGVTVPVLLDDDGAVAVATKDVEVTVEPGTEPIVTIDQEDALLHEGLVYLGGYVNETLGIGAETTLGITTISGCTCVHAFLRAVAGGDAHLWLYEDVTYSGGTPITMFNRNRISANVLTKASVDGNPTVTVSGTVIAESIIPGGNFAALSMGGSAVEERGWILKEATQYVMRLLNLSAGVEPVSMGVVILDEN